MPLRQRRDRNDQCACRLGACAQRRPDLPTTVRLPTPAATVRRLRLHHRVQVRQARARFPAAARARRARFRRAESAVAPLERTIHLCPWTRSGLRWAKRTFNMHTLSSGPNRSRRRPGPGPGPVPGPGPPPRCTGSPAATGVWALAPAGRSIRTRQRSQNAESAHNSSCMQSLSSWSADRPRPRHAFTPPNHGPRDDCIRIW